jgi:hypothetical protein
MAHEFQKSENQPFLAGAVHHTTGLSERKPKDFISISVPAIPIAPSPIMNA